jgi:hypothetical protein
MWTEDHRRIYRPAGGGDASDLGDAVLGAQPEPLIPDAAPGGRPEDRHAASGECHSVFAENRLPLTLSQQPSVALVYNIFRKLQHLSQVAARWRPGDDLGRAAYGIARTIGSRSQPLRRSSRQPVDEICRKRAINNDNQRLTTPASRQRPARSMPRSTAKVPMRSLSALPRFTTATRPVWFTIRDAAASIGSN